jgi:hypothetical protein
MIDAVSLTLRHVLNAALAAPGGHAPTVSLDSPALLAAREGAGVSLWLYRVAVDPRHREPPPGPAGAAASTTQAAPLQLHYLITPLAAADDPEGAATEQALLGRVLAAFDAAPVVRGAALRGALAGTPTTLQVRLESLALAELTRLWRALRQPLQLSVAFEVTLGQDLTAG